MVAIYGHGFPSAASSRKIYVLITYAYIMTWCLVTKRDLLLAYITSSGKKSVHDNVRLAADRKTKTIPSTGNAKALLRLRPCISSFLSDPCSSREKRRPRQRWRLSGWSICCCCWKAHQRQRAVPRGRPRLFLTSCTFHQAGIIYDALIRVRLPGRTRSVCGGTSRKRNTAKHSVLEQQSTNSCYLLINVFFV
jgi:hypothetical protein